MLCWGPSAGNWLRTVGEKDGKSNLWVDVPYCAMDQFLIDVSFSRKEKQDDFYECIIYMHTCTWIIYILHTYCIYFHAFATHTVSLQNRGRWLFPTPSCHTAPWLLKIETFARSKRRKTFTKDWKLPTHSSFREVRLQTHCSRNRVLKKSSFSFKGLQIHQTKEQSAEKVVFLLLRWVCKIHPRYLSMIPVI